MAITVIHELAGSPQESWNSGRFTAVQQLIVPWAERHELMALKLMYGGAPYVNTPPGFTNIVCRNATAVPFGGAGALQSGFDDPDPPEGAVSSYASYENALVTLEYSSPQGHSDFVKEGGDFISETIEPTAEFMVLDHRRFRWGNATDGPPLNPEEAPGKLERGLDYEFTRYNLTSVPFAVLDLVGKVNEAAVQCKLLGLAFGAETLLFNPPNITRSINANGEAVVTAKYRMTFRTNTWNKFWRIESGAYEEIYVDKGSKYKNYKTGNFSIL